MKWGYNGLSHDNQHLVLHKNQYISKFDQIIKDFEYLSLKVFQMVNSFQI